MKRPIKVGKWPSNEGKRPIKAMVLVGISVGCLMGCFRAPPPWQKTAPLKRSKKEVYDELDTVYVLSVGLSCVTVCLANRVWTHSAAIFSRHHLSGLPNANAKSQCFSYAISQIATLPPVVALNRSSKSQIAARYAAFWHAVSQIALESFL